MSSARPDSSKRSGPNEHAGDASGNPRTRGTRTRTTKERFFMARLLKKARHRLFKSRSIFSLSARATTSIRTRRIGMDTDLAWLEIAVQKLACILLHSRNVAVPDRTAWPQGPQVTEEDEKKTKGRTRNENDEATPDGGGDVRFDGRGCAGSGSQSGSGQGSAAGGHSRGAGSDRRDASISR